MTAPKNEKFTKETYQQTKPSNKEKSIILSCFNFPLSIFNFQSPYEKIHFSLTDSPVTLTATATSGLPVSYRCANTSVARINGNTLLLLSNGTTTVTAYQNGNEYGYYPATPVTKTLTVANVGIPTVEATQIKAYPNPTSGQVTIDLANLPPIQPIVRDSSDIQVTLSDEAGAFVKYGNPFRQRVNIQIESGELKVESGVVTAWLTDMQGKREEVRLTPAGNGKYTLDLTSRPQSHLPPHPHYRKRQDPHHKAAETG